MLGKRKNSDQGFKIKLSSVSQLLFIKSGSQNRHPPKESATKDVLTHVHRNPVNMMQETCRQSIGVFLSLMVWDHQLGTWTEENPFPI